MPGDERHGQPAAGQQQRVPRAAVLGLVREDETLLRPGDGEQPAGDHDLVPDQPRDRGPEVG